LAHILPENTPQHPASHFANLVVPCAFQLDRQISFPWARFSQLLPDSAQSTQDARIGFVRQRRE